MEEGGGIERVFFDILPKLSYNADTMINKVLKYVEKYRMIEPGDTIAAGVSGGADSVCLLFVLLELQKKIPFSVKVVHINHGIRQDASEDAAYVRALCERLGIPFFLVETDVRAQAKAHGRSEEEEGRYIRYQSFEKVLGGDAGRIAVAHNSNDRAETVLFHLFRGTGLSGLCGIRPVNGRVIRPLLCLKREEIENWLRERDISFCTDSTNEKDVYTRNKIRRHILPYAEREICRGAAAHISQAAGQMMEAEAYITRQTKAAMARCTAPAGNGKGVRVNLPAFLKEDEYLRGRILLECVAQAAGSRKDITSTHIDSAEKIFAGNGNRQAHLPYGLLVYKEYDWGMIQKREHGRETETGMPAHGEEAGEYEVAVPAGSTPSDETSAAVMAGGRLRDAASVKVEIPGFGPVECTVFERKEAFGPGAGEFAPESQNIPEKTYTKWFDYDKITSSVVFRHRQKGDYLTINSKMNRKSLQDYFVNEKIPAKERDACFVLAEGSHILWVPGRRISEYYKISEGTERILQVSVTDKNI